MEPEKTVVSKDVPTNNRRTPTARQQLGKQLPAETDTE
jgi:hypothetical protein